MLITRCPACATSFRVQPEQLRARNGRVRCGRCHTAFSALESLVEQGSIDVMTSASSDAKAPALPPAPHVEEDRAPSGGQQPTSLERSSEPEPHFAIDAAVAAPVPTQSSSVHAAETEDVRSDDALGARAPAGTVASPTTAAPQGTPETPGDPSFETENAAEHEAPGEHTVMLMDAVAREPEVAASALVQPTRRSHAWWGALLVTGVAAVMQGVLLFRHDLVKANPELRPPLLQLCQVLGCALPLPSDPSLIEIDGSDLIPDSVQAERYTFSASLRNRAGFEQAWPHLGLTLTDRFDRALARRVFAPAEWLPQAERTHSGFAARGEVALALVLEARGLPAAGYRIHVFYP